MAKLYFHYAAMNAGKTTMLLQASYNYRERGMSTMLFVAGHYRRDDQAGYVSSRIGLEADAEMFRDGDDLFARSREHHAHTTTHCVFVDEAQFLEDEQVWQLARVADRLNIPVMCYGLRTDFQAHVLGAGEIVQQLADARQVALAHLVDHEGVRRVQHGAAVLQVGLQRTQPGMHILRRQFGFQAFEAAGPGVHRRGQGENPWKISGTGPTERQRGSLGRGRVHRFGGSAD